MALRTLYLIRHGQYQTGVKHPDGGSLTEKGCQQARIAGAALAHIPFSAIYASTMTRARETAVLIAEHVPVEIYLTDLLREALPGIPPRFAEEILGMMQRDPSITHETIHQDRLRADQAFEQFFIPPDEKSDTHEALVCHGNMVRYLTCKALGIHVDTWAKMNIHHCGITTITVDEQGSMRLVSHNETRHLPLELVSDF
jgi:serine/threonine-protein phosphatase PGAM5